MKTARLLRALAGAVALGGAGLACAIFLARPAAAQERPDLESLPPLPSGPLVVPRPSANPPPPPLVINQPPPVFPMLRAPGVETHVDLQNLFLFRTNSDFDSSTPAYDAKGKTVGVLATVLRPSFAWHIDRNLRIFYQAELGLNFWGRQNPDQQNPLGSDIFVMKHRELWAQGELLDDRLHFKVGYGFFRDTTALFLAHWIGAAQASYRFGERTRVGLFFGQIPDPTKDGINTFDNTFKRDIWVFGAQASVQFTSGLRLDIGVHNLVDNHLVDQSRWVIAPNLHLEYSVPSAVAFLDLVLQTGSQEGARLGGGSETIHGWAAQGHLEWRLSSKLLLTGNLLLLSPDDAYPGNGWDNTFRYSGKSRSSTLMLTEDEVRDWYDNVDERMSRSDSGFFKNRAGLMVADAKLTWAVTERFRPSLIVGAATVLKPGNADGNTFVGLETDLVLEYHLSKNFMLLFAGGLLVPGAAGSVLLNKIDRTQTAPIGLIEASMLVRY